MDYTIAAKPTVYRGRQYRSRLEARWAAFFDLLGWSHEYEPFDLGSWSPDFLLTDWSVLVEVKPWEELDQATWDKAVGACAARGILEQNEHRETVGGIFLTRLAPKVTGDRLHRSIAEIGWFGTRYSGYRNPQRAALIWETHYQKPTFTAEICSLGPDGWFTAGGSADGWDSPCPHGLRGYGIHTLELWASATNAVQWQVGGQS